MRRLLPSISLVVLMSLSWASGAQGMCNIIPPAEVAYPSSTGSITNPIAAPQDTVELRLTGCDQSMFAANSASNAVSIAFHPPGGGPATVVAVPPGTVSVDCSGGPCFRLTFPMPVTRIAFPPHGLSGPATITVKVPGDVTVASVGPLFQPHVLGSTCDKAPETVFQHFTVVPTPNKFGDVETGAVSQVLATLDGSGSIIIPFDYRQVLQAPLAPGEPIARFLSGASTVDAFTSNPGVPIQLPSTAYVRSFTIDGRPLPPLLRATNAGNEIFGATDGAVGIVRVARTGPQGGPVFDLSDRLTLGGVGPIVIPSSQYAVASAVPIPLENLHSTGAGVAFAVPESIEGDLNQDGDDLDDVVQIIEVATFTNTGTKKAASLTNNPIVGGAAVDTSDTLAAFFESEQRQGAADQNGDGDARDDVLRIYQLDGTERTPFAPPNALLVGSPFPGISRGPLGITGDVVFYREARAGMSESTSFLSGHDVLITPDGRTMVTTTVHPTCGPRTSGLRDGETGRPRGFQANSGFCNNTGNGSRALAVRPDGAVMFIAAGISDTVTSLDFSYGPDNVLVNVLDLEREGTGGVVGLNGARALAVSADGANLYVASRDSDGVASFAITAAGQLTFLGAQVGLALYDDPRAIVVSPDGLHAYVAAHGTNNVRAFTRAPGGTLSVFASFADGGGGGFALAGPTGIAISADGRSVYVTADGDQAVSTFTRNPATGILTFAGALFDGAGGVTGLTGPQDVVISPDQQAVYVSTNQGQLAVFARNDATGALTFVETVGTPVAGPLAGSELAISPDGEHVYQQFEGTAPMRLYERKNRVHAFDAALGGNQPELGAPESGLAAAAAGRVAFLDPEQRTVTLYDAVTKQTTTGVADGVGDVRRVALSAQILALSVPEASLGKDGNDDGDLLDDVLVVVPTSDPTGKPTIVPAEATDVGATDVCAGGTSAGAACTTDADCAGGKCRGVAVVITNEAHFGEVPGPPPPEADLNGNGIASDLVLQLYDTATKKLQNSGWRTIDFVVRGNVVAFRVPESSDLNGNNSVEETVMFVVDLATKAVVNTRQSVITCGLPGCEAGLPYSVRGDAVFFLSSESHEGPTDLDGDGDANDVVSRIFNVRTATVQNGGAAIGAYDLPPVPTTFLGEPIAYTEVLESDVGRDVNEDGDLNDVVVLVDGDSDGDGTFDSDDVCVETPNPSQLDSDGDGLGDACDPNGYCRNVTPPSPPVLGPEPLDLCQEAVAKEARKLTLVALKAAQSCLGKLTTGKLSGGADGLCRGNLASGQLVRPTDPKGGVKVAKAMGKFAKTIAVRCTPAQLSTIDACDTTTPEKLAACVAARAADVVRVTTGATFGDALRIMDPLALRCQKALGKAGVKYFATASGGTNRCLDGRNAVNTILNGQTLCLGASTLDGLVAPTDATLVETLGKLDESLLKTLTKACPAPVAAALGSCGGGDPADLVACIRCSHWPQVAALVKAAYGPNP